MLKITGQRFGRLVAISPSSVAVGGSKSGNWLFQCDCGEKTVKPSRAVRQGVIKSCGCLHREGSNFKHGHCKSTAPSLTWSAWQNAKSRCYDPNSVSFARYGGRGIGMSRAWYSSFSQFLADMGEAPPGTSIERIDNDGHYEKGNCRWATPTQQMRNTSTNVIVQIDGRQMSFAEAAELVGAPYKPLWFQVRKKGLPFEEGVRRVLCA